MAVIESGLFVQIADRLAKQARIIDQATVDAQVTGGGKFYPRIHSNLTSTGDIDVENDLIKPASDLDNDIKPTDLFNTIYASFITSTVRHVQRLGFTNLDKYLSTTGASGINVDDGFAKAYLGVTGGELDAVNVFGPETNIGLITFTGSGVGSLTKENAVGSGGTEDHTDTASSGFVTGKHAAANMRVFVASGLGTPTTISLFMKLENGTFTPSGLNVIFSGTEAAVVGTSKDIGAATDFFLDVSGVQLAGGNTPLVLQIKSKLERTVAL